MVRIGDSIFGGAGDLEEMGLFFSWKRGLEKPDFADTVNFDILEVSKEGIFLWNPKLSPIKVIGKVMAVGSGGQLAIGAMEMGADPEKAILVASKYDVHTRAPIEMMAL